MSDSSSNSNSSSYSNDLDPSKFLDKYISDQNVLDSFATRIVEKIKTKFAAGLLKRQSGTRKTIARDHEEGHRRLVADYFANQPLYPERMKMFSCPIHGAELLTANDGSSGNGHMMQWFNEESIFD
uniref:Uncharacterized protein n=1 Tax=Oryza rufipogon TaxID=4529 RepID=A0A0E0QND5_ORYRU